jgi:hypothetical protein
MIGMPFNSNSGTGRVSRSLVKFAGRLWLARILAGTLFCGMVHLSMAATSAPFSTSYNLTFLWDSSSSPDVANYRLYYGGASGTYTNSVLSSGTTTATISGLSCGVTYYFAVTAVGADGQESDFSGEIVYRREFPGAQLALNRLPGGGYALTVAGLGGRSYDIQATVDFKTWIFIGSATVGADGIVNFTDPNAVHFSHRFYRAQETPSGEAAFARARMQIQGGAGNPLKLSITGLAGHTYDIEATVDFTVWTVIGTVTLATDGSVDFTDPDAPTFSRRFYRTREKP